jgi:IS30 family transposase
MRYSAQAAQNKYEARLVSAREGVAITPEQMAKMMLTVDKLVRQGWSIEAIYAEHGGEMPVGIRTCYTYIDKGFAGVSNIDLPRKVRYKPRKSKKDPGRDRVDRTGRTFDDFRALPLEDQVRVVQADSVLGYDHNVQTILTLHLVRHSFQLYVLQPGLAPELTVAALDAVEASLGSPAAFEAVFGVMLADRGVEFDDWAGMERSCLAEGARRCRVFYCDAQNSNQKSQAERNHERLRRILPKKRSDFDKLSVWDVAVCCSHVNSYPLARKSGTFRPIEAAAALIPQHLLDALGVERVPADEVVLKPYLMAHAVEQ